MVLNATIGRHTESMKDKEKLTRDELSRLVGSNIRRFRNYSELSQDELAERLDVSKNYISMMETGVKFPSAETLVRLCNTFDIECYELFCDYTSLSGEELKQKVLDSLSREFVQCMSKSMDDMTIFKI